MFSSEERTSNLFKGTAWYYARYRLAYPKAVISLLREQIGGERLVDLGCGTGELSVPMANYVKEVIGVDPQEEMLNEARLRASRADISNISWRCCRAEDLNIEPSSVDMVTIGAAFHWMDRPLVVARAGRWLKKGAPIAILGWNSTWNGQEPWQEIAREVLTNWLGPRKAGKKGSFIEPSEPHEVVLAKAGCHVTETVFEEPQCWSLEEFIGYLYSTSFASHEVIGDRALAFEEDMRRRLLQFDSSGIYKEKVRFYCLTCLGFGG